MDDLSPEIQECFPLLSPSPYKDELPTSSPWNSPSTALSRCKDDPIEPRTSRPRRPRIRRPVDLLPLPRWGLRCSKIHLSLAQYEDLFSQAKSVLQRILVTENYDSVSNFIALYDAYEASGNKNLQELFTAYIPPIRAKKHTCVGLALELMKQLRNLEGYFPGLKDALALVSCEEGVIDEWEYVSEGSGPKLFASKVDKEHVLVAVHMHVNGRVGMLLMDPGFHVAHPVAVMADRDPPHTGWFVQNEYSHNRKFMQYNYNAVNANYIEWRIRSKKDSPDRDGISLIYVDQPFLSGVNVTERRNLVYTLRSMVKRDENGFKVAGLYFPIAVHDSAFILFYQRSHRRTFKKHFSFSAFANPDKISAKDIAKVDICNAQMQYADGELLQVICRVARITADTTFITQLLAINDAISEVSCLRRWSLTDEHEPTTLDAYLFISYILIFIYFIILHTYVFIKWFLDGFIAK